MKQNRILYGILLFLSFTFIYFYGGKVPYMLFFLTLALPFVSLLYTVIIYFRFKYTQHIDSEFVLKGSRVNFIFSVNNEDIFLYPYISVTFRGSEAVFARQFQTRNFSIYPFSKKSFEIELFCKYRGMYEIGINSVEIQDFLGIIKLAYRVHNPKVVTVYPRIIQLDRFFLKTDYMSESHSVLNTNSEDMSTISDVRNFAYGDGLKRIHWKLTAKLGNLMVKKYQSTSVTNVLLFLDLMKNNLPEEQNTVIEDKVIETAISILHYCLFNWVPVKLVYYNEEVVNINADNPLMFNELYNILAKVKFTQNVGVGELLDVCLNDSINKANVLIVTSNLSYGLYNQIYRLASSGYDTSLLYISPENITGINDAAADNIMAFIPEIGVSAYRIDINDDIKLVLER